MASQDRTSPQASCFYLAAQAIDNVVLFGVSQSGKTSLANLITGKSIATSDSYPSMLPRPTFHYDEVVIGGKIYRIWNTSGFDDMIGGQSPSGLRKAVNCLLRALSKFGGISLLLFCTRANRLRPDLITFYNIFYSGICRKKVPIIMVFTSIHERGDQRPEEWWVKNEEEVHKQVHLDGHLCVTVLDVVTARTMSPTIQRLLQESADSVRAVIASNCRRPWKIDEASWASAAVPDVYSFMKGPSALIPNVIVYNTPEASDPSSPSSDSRSQLSSKPTLAFQSVEINDNLFNVYNVPDVNMDAGMHLYSRTSSCRPDLLIFCASNTITDTHERLEKFYTSWAGQTTPLLVVVKGADTHEAAAEWWRGVCRSPWTHGSKPALVVQLGFLPAIEGSQDVARKHLRDLICRFCLERRRIESVYPIWRGLRTRWFRQTRERQESAMWSFDMLVNSLAYTTTGNSSDVGNIPQHDVSN
ncbi:hypothetical protein EDB19DRAFT_1752469 [Suillus lakei]|nr:hypothetical protein EDB19DRAFT_1752469 [Suillus lakei]